MNTTTTASVSEMRHSMNNKENKVMNDLLEIEANTLKISDD